MNMENQSEISFPTSEEFTHILGQVTWLMTRSPDLRDKNISWVEANIVSALVFKQIRVVTKGKKPLAAVIWAYASKEVRSKIEGGDYVMDIRDWRSGADVVVVQCIAPGIDSELVKSAFLQEVEELKPSEPS